LPLLVSLQIGHQAPPPSIFTADRGAMRPRKLSKEDQMFRKFVFKVLTLAAVGLGLTATSYAHVVTIESAPGVIAGRVFKLPNEPEVPVPVPGTNLLQFTFNVENRLPNTLITGVGFALPGENSGFQLVSGPSNFSLAQGVTNGFGTGETFDYALLSVNSGTGVATNQTFNFIVNAPSFAGLATGEQIIDYAFVRFEAAGPGGFNGVGQAFIPQAVPEPATMLLLGTGLAGVGAAVRKRRKTEE